VQNGHHIAHLECIIALYAEDFTYSRWPRSNCVTNTA
jgi:hypothetical protein